jgi:hypothetical protein
LILIGYAEAATIGVSPSIIRLNKVLKGGYSETAILTSTSIEAPLKAHLTKEGEISEWMNFDPIDEEFIFSKDEPYGFMLIIQPPEDTLSGNYTGILKITTDEIATVESGAGSSVLAQVAVLIYVEVIGDQIIACRAGAIYTGGAEIGSPFSFHATISNDGNARIRPKVTINVLDQYQSQILKTHTVFGDEVLPTRSKETLRNVENDLPVGQYFADIYIEECDVHKLTTFDILQKGQMSDSGELIGIKTNDVASVNELVPIVPIFRNTGARKVLAQFKGEITNLGSSRTVQVLESEAIEVEPGGTVEFKLFFIPEEVAEYQISGRVVYNNKFTFDDSSRIVKVLDEGKDPNWLIYLMIYFIIGLLILILIAKIRKAKKRR